MVFQEPMTALNPVMTLGAQVEEVLGRHPAVNMVAVVGVPVFLATIRSRKAMSL